MIDWYAALVIGLALFIGLFPLIYKKYRSGDFLLVYHEGTIKEYKKKENR